MTTAWLGAFAHNGLHMWSRRRAEALTMYLTFSNNPFRWMYKHVVSHHVHTNTCFDGDKKVCIRTFTTATMNTLASAAPRDHIL